MLRIARRLVAGWTPAAEWNATDLGFASALTTCRLKDRMVLARALSVSKTTYFCLLLLLNQTVYFVYYF